MTIHFDFIIIRTLPTFKNFTTQDYSTLIIGYSDMDWGSDPNDRKSFTGYIFIVHGGPVSWRSHDCRSFIDPMLHGKQLQD